MDIDAAALAAAAAPDVGGAVAAYGMAVLSKVEDASASATVRLGARLLQRFSKRKESASAVQQAVEELAESPNDEERLTVLRAELRRAIQSDRQLAADIASLLRESGVNIQRSGDRSVTMQHNAGIVQTGDGSAAWQGPGER